VVWTELNCSETYQWVFSKRFVEVLAVLFTISSSFSHFSAWWVRVTLQSVLCTLDTHIKLRTLCQWLAASQTKAIDTTVTSLTTQPIAHNFGSVTSILTINRSQSIHGNGECAHHLWRHLLLLIATGSAVRRNHATQCPATCKISTTRVVLGAQWTSRALWQCRDWLYSWRVWRNEDHSGPAHAATLTWTQFRPRFYRAACNADAVLWSEFCPSVCPSVTRVYCDKTVELSRLLYHTKEHLA